MIIFGISEADGFVLTGVYDPQDIQKKVAEQCEQMQPKVRPLFTVCEIDGKYVVSAEIGECDTYEKPCLYFAKVRENKKQLSALDDERILSLQGIIQNGKPTIAGEMLFGVYPQSLFPQYSIIASVVPGTEIGQLGEMGERFSDDKRIEGTIEQMLEDAVSFVVRNMKRKIIIGSDGKRADKTQYPIAAVREAVLNALIHRDYSIHTENSPIRLLMFDNRMEIENPGGLYGRGTIEKLGETGLDTRNPYIAGALELLIGSENRYSGIPTMRFEMKSHSLPDPVFESSQGVFRVTLYNDEASAGESLKLTDQILSYCASPRSREELAERFDFSAPTYFISKYVRPLVREGRLGMTIPDKPKSKNQHYFAK